ncbi:MAG: M81 family metallopeptidase [Acidimicrobiia bacterium]|nr:M81 family metallopeptidase [Acidimicrobiia bacterium]MDH5291784.1 M81 family metallopeptidase [Acidimicrobiia bacterium]
MTARRVVVAMMEHETNTFSPVPTPLARFARGGGALYRAGFAGISARDIPCNGVGVTSSDNALFRFEKVRRPIFPLDEHTPATPEYGPPPA